ncbi:MAG: hypothetical protein LC792_27165 [Actinobacteria bacterium]|nr:hypothetical protein [Actinomycetota bacterium]
MSEPVTGGQGRPPWWGGPPPAIGADEARGILDFFAWRERIVLDGEERLHVPYEYPYDRIFSSAEEAFAGKLADASREHWVLIHYRGEVVAET